MPSLSLLDLTLPPLSSPWYKLAGILGLGGLAWGIGSLPLPLAVSLSVCFWGALVVLVNPLWTVYGLIPLIPFSPWLSLSLGGVNVSGMELLLGLGWIGTGLHVLARRNTPTLQVSSVPMVGAFVLFLSALMLSWLNALSLKASFIETTKWLEMGLLYLWLVTFLPTKDLPRLVTVILLTGVAQATLGLYQFIFKIGPEGFLLFGGRFLRAYGTFGQPNPYAGYLGLILPLAIALTWWKFNNLKTNLAHWKVNLFLALPLSGVLLALGAALFASQSRSGWVAAAAATLVVLALLSRLARLVLSLTLLGGIMLGLAGALTFNVFALETPPQNLSQIVLQRFVEAAAIFQIEDITQLELTDANFATLERLAHWQAAWGMWRDNFWLGVGFGNYELVYPSYAVGLWQDPLGHAHNYLFNLGAETGLIGVICYIIFWFITLIYIGRTVRRTTGFAHVIAVGGVGIMVHLHVHNLFDNLYVQGMYLHLAMILAFISILWRQEVEAPSSRCDSLSKLSNLGLRKRHLTSSN